MIVHDTETAVGRAEWGDPVETYVDVADANSASGSRPMLASIEPPVGHLTLVTGDAPADAKGLRVRRIVLREIEEAFINGEVIHAAGRRAVVVDYSARIREEAGIAWEEAKVTMRDERRLR
jgi:hypothetical protein